MTYAALKRTVAPSALPVSLADAKAHCRVDGDYDEIYLQGLVAAATAHAEKITGLGLISQTWEQWIRPNPSDARLEVGGFVSLTDVSYYDKDDTLQTANLSDFKVILGRDRVSVKPNDGVMWPATAIRDDAIRLTYTVGGTAADVPADVVHAIKLLTGHWYENRETVTLANMKETPLAFNALIEDHKVGWYG